MKVRIYGCNLTFMFIIDLMLGKLRASIYVAISGSGKVWYGRFSQKLIGHRTASAGEALLTAFLQRPNSATFGTSTAGLTTSVYDGLWPDGSSLAISAGRYADRRGQVIQGKIYPDHAVATIDSTDEDSVLAAAKSWISNH